MSVILAPLACVIAAVFLTKCAPKAPHDGQHGADTKHDKIHPGVIDMDIHFAHHHGNGEIAYARPKHTSMNIVATPISTLR